MLIDNKMLKDNDGAKRVVPPEIILNYEVSRVHSDLYITMVTTCGFTLGYLGSRFALKKLENLEIASAPVHPTSAKAVFVCNICEPDQPT